MNTTAVKLVQIGQSVLAGNDDAASRNRQRLDDAGTIAINIIAGPGAGKTSLIVRSLEALTGRARTGVIEGDIAGSIDADRVLAAGAVDVVQINTGGNCHLEANMVDRALDDLNLNDMDLLFVENVGNLVCPTHWALGERLRICLVGASEGDDKPVKYPEIFAVSDVIVLNKIDLIDYVNFDREFFMTTVRALNPAAPVFELSCRTVEGFEPWIDWLLAQRTEPISAKESMSCVSR